MPTREKVTCVNKTGWHGNVYVLQDEVVGTGADSVILQTSSVQGKDFRVAGTSDEWREHIGKYCVGNARLAFSVSLAFASSLLKLVGVGGGGYHLKGESTDGKTTTMKVVLLFVVVPITGTHGGQQVTRLRERLAVVMTLR